MLNSLRDLMLFLNMIMQQQHMDSIQNGCGCEGADSDTLIVLYEQSVCVADCDYVLG